LPALQKDSSKKGSWVISYKEFGQNRYQYPSNCDNYIYFYKKYNYTTGDLNNIYRCKKISCRGKNFLKTLDN